MTIAVHLAHCGECTDSVSELEAAAGEALVTGQEASVAPTALSRLLARVDSDGGPEVAAGHQAETVGHLTLPPCLPKRMVGFRRWLTPDLWTAPIKTPQVDGWRTFLLHAPKGLQVPVHGHRGGELIAVLSGSFADGIRYGAGDFAESSAGSAHGLTVGEDGPCMCVIAMEGRAKWAGWARAVSMVLDV